ncbi:deoxynucleoside kinase-like [Daphnia pulicaria]|uniref:deoxynucleoside kinase-like n=1 Tax=Daphnia pulicaria TaxID=35523 RepID=UPI001EEB16BE|nr:deoxynucleoside kinase-like [Daphnia pulicaria]
MTSRFVQKWSQLLYSMMRNTRKTVKSDSRPSDFPHRTLPFLKSMDKRNKPFTVVIEGNIGSGKTTLLNYFSKYRDVEVLQEPVEKWRNVDGHNLLSLLYDDPARWSLTFQTHVQLTMLDHHTKETSAKVKLMERSLFSGRYCFVENLHESKLMEPAEYAVISEWFKWITKNVDVEVDLIVYLRSDPEVVHKRILQRARKEEKTVPLSYIVALHEIHEDWLHHKVSHPVPAPVLEIDANVDLTEMLKQISLVENQILNRKAIKRVLSSPSSSPSKLVSPA